MVIKTRTPKVIEARKTILELILAHHPQDCLNCIRNENCELQSLAAEYCIRDNPFELKVRGIAKLQNPRQARRGGMGVVYKARDTSLDPESWR